MVIRTYFVTVITDKQECIQYAS